MIPLLRWAGSKRKLLPTLLDLAPDGFDRYVEPFAGSACLFFALETKHAILTDINEDLINLYLEIRDNVEAVIECVTDFKCTKEEYYSIRALDLNQLSPPRRAARFIYLNRYCFNGLYRTNKRGDFNVPYGGYKCGVLPPASTLRSCSIALRDVILAATSFEKTLQEVRSGDFVYIDPPYSIRSRRVFNGYSHFNFGDDQLTTLRSHLKRLDHLGVSFLVSYGLSKEAKDLGKNFDCREVVVHRNIASFANKRRKSRELLITNY